MLKQRVITGLFISIFIGTMVYFSNNYWISKVFSSILCMFSVYELFKVSGLLEREEIFMPTLLLAISNQFIDANNYVYIFIIVFVSAIMIFSFLMYKINKFSPNIKIPIVGISLIISILFKTFSEFSLIYNGRLHFAVGILVCVTTDIFAYFIGRKWGKRKLCPNISYNKTVEGALGGLVSSIAIALIVGIIINITSDIYVNYIYLIFGVCLISIISQFGDLAMSCLKRITGYKDYGNILPGHGGILDRFDSMLFGVSTMFLLISFGYYFFI